jgi:hypothetical protein
MKPDKESILLSLLYVSYVLNVRPEFFWKIIKTKRKFK